MIYGKYGKIGKKRIEEHGETFFKIVEHTHQCTICMCLFLILSKQEKSLKTSSAGNATLGDAS